MPAPSIHALAVKLKETYADMEYQRDGSLVSSGVSSVVSTLSFGFAQAQPMSIKTPKLDTLVNATTDAEIIAALKTLREDKEVTESTSLKNIVDIYDHAVQASLGLYAENTAPEIVAASTPAEAAQDAIDNLTATYHLQFAKVANRADFLRLITLSLREQLKIEKQQALAALTAQLTQEKQEAVVAAREKQHIITIEEIARLEERHQRESAAALHTQKLEIERVNEIANSAYDEISLTEDILATEKARITSLTAGLATAEATASLHAENLNTANIKIRWFEGQLGLTKQELSYMKNAAKKQETVLRETTSQVETLTAQVSAQEDMIKNLGQEAIKAQEDIAESRKRSIEEIRIGRQLQNDNQRLKNENTTLSAQMQMLENKLNILKDIVAIQQDLQKEQDNKLNNADFSKELKAEQAAYAQLNNEYRRAEAQINHLESELSSITGTLKPLTDQNSKLRRQVSDLTDQAAKLTAQIEKMRMNISSASSYNNRLHHQKQHKQHGHQQHAQQENLHYIKPNK
jgi:predicted  nucleic acid-binding Zn-ribbon protein